MNPGGEVNSPAPVAATAPARARDRHRIDWYLAAPIIGPAALLLARNADFMFDPAGWVDTFGLLGRFWHYAEQNPLFEEYKNSRLPWILPGMAVHRLFDTVTASYILHTTTLVASSIALYLLVRDALRDRRAAAVASAAWSCYTWIHGDGGWDYHILAACAYYLLSTWMIVRSASSPASRAWTWAIGAGAALACAIHTHLVFAGFVPIATLLALVTPNGGVRSGLRSLAVGGAYALIGAIGMTALLGAVNAAIGGRWLFFVPQLEYTLMLTGGNRWTRDPGTWIPGAAHLVIPALILFAGILWFVARWSRHRRDDSVGARFATTLVLQGFLAAGLMTFLQFVGHQTVLDPSYAAYPLYCHTFMMLGVLLCADSGGRWHSALVLAVPLLIVAPLLLLLPSKLPVFATSVLQSLQLPPSLVLLPPLAIGAIAVLLMCGIRGRARLAVFAVSFGLLNAWVTFSQTAYGIGSPGVNRDTLVVIRSLDRYTSTLDPSLFAIRFWREGDIVPGPLQPVNLHDLFDSFLSTRRRSLVTAAYDRPEIIAEELTPDDLYTERCLGVLSATSSHAATVDRITRRFGELGLQLDEVGRHQAVSGPLSVSLTVLALHDGTATARGADPCVRKGEQPVSPAPKG